MGIGWDVVGVGIYGLVWGVWSGNMRFNEKGNILGVIWK